MQLIDGYQDVKKALGEGSPWLFDDATIVKRLARSARALASAAQFLRDTYAFSTAINPNVAGGGTFYQEYAMPEHCESIIGGKVQIGTLWPLDFSATQQQIQTGGYVAGAPVIGYTRRGSTFTQQIPGSSESVMPVPGATGKYAPWIVGLYPIPADVYPVFIDFVAYHPTLQSPLDPVLLPDITNIFDAWTAYAISKGMADQGDAERAQIYMQMHIQGLEDCKQYVFAQQCQLTQPQWGSGGIWNQGGLTILTMAPTAANLAMD